MKYLLLFLFTAVMCNAQPLRPNMYGINLLSNPGAETENSENHIPHWKPLPATDDWDFMNDAYGHTGGEWDWECDEKCGLPPLAGKSYFRLPVDNSNPMYGLWQEVNITGVADDLANGKILYSVSCYIAGFKCESTGCGKGILSITFYDNAGKEINIYNVQKDNFEMKQANPEDGRMRQFEKMGRSGELPKNAVKAKITMMADSKECCNGAYVFFDNLDFSLMKEMK